MGNINTKLKKDYDKPIKETTIIEIQIQQWGDNRKLSMELIALEHFTVKDKIRRNELRSKFHSYKSDENEQDDCGSNSLIVHLFNQSIELELLVSIL